MKADQMERTNHYKHCEAQCVIILILSIICCDGCFFLSPKQKTILEISKQKAVSEKINQEEGEKVSKEEIVIATRTALKKFKEKEAEYEHQESHLQYLIFEKQYENSTKNKYSLPSFPQPFYGFVLSVENDYSYDVSLLQAEKEQNEISVDPLKESKRRLLVAHQKYIEAKKRYEALLKECVSRFSNAKEAEKECKLLELK